MIEAANSYFMLYLGFRQGLVQDNFSCHAKSEGRVSEFFKYFTCFAGNVRGKQEVCGYSEENLSGVNKISEENCASVRSWHGDPLPSWGQHFTLCSLSQVQHRQPSLCIHISLSCGSHIRQHLSVQTSIHGLQGPSSSLSLVKHPLPLPKLQLKILLMSLPAVFQTTHHGCSVFTTSLLPVVISP